MKEEKIKSGQYFAVKHYGNNGDLILGKVKSVRKTGEIIFTNLLTGKISTKDVNVVKQRNVRIRKKRADEALKMFKETQDEQKVRQFLVNSRREEENDNSPQQILLKARSPILQDLDELRRRFALLFDEMQNISGILSRLEKQIEKQL